MQKFVPSNKQKLEIKCDGMTLFKGKVFRVDFELNRHVHTCDINGILHTIPSNEFKVELKAIGIGVEKTKKGKGK